MAARWGRRLVMMEMIVAVIKMMTVAKTIPITETTIATITVVMITIMTAVVMADGDAVLVIRVVMICCIGRRGDRRRCKGNQAAR